jgi:hypothetical protein
MTAASTGEAEADNTGGSWPRLLVVVAVTVAVVLALVFVVTTGRVEVGTSVVRDVLAKSLVPHPDMATTRTPAPSPAATRRTSDRSPRAANVWLDAPRTPLKPQSASTPRAGGIPVSLPQPEAKPVP